MVTVGVADRNDRHDVVIDAGAQLVDAEGRSVIDLREGVVGLDGQALPGLRDPPPELVVLQLAEIRRRPYAQGAAEALAPGRFLVEPVELAENTTDTLGKADALAPGEEAGQPFGAQALDDLQGELAVIRTRREKGRSFVVAAQEPRHVSAGRAVVDRAS